MSGHGAGRDPQEARGSGQDSSPKGQSLSDLVFGKTVTVISSKKDKYGRVLGKITLDGKDINQEQIDGNRKSKIYHFPNCPDYSKVSEHNRVP